MTAVTHSADRNLLFAILALQMDFISRDQLVAGMNAWVLEKSKPLGQILVEQKVLRADLHGALETMVEKHLEMHGQDAAESLAALSASSLASNLSPLINVADANVQASLAHMASAATPDDPLATQSFALGAASSGARFRILRPHARGGLGQVFVAHDEELHREVALKDIQERFADNVEARTRFLVEAEITGGLEHPGIVPVYGLGHHPDGRPFYAMRFIKGDSLKKAIEKFHQVERGTRSAERGAQNTGSVPRSALRAPRNLEFRALLRRFLDVCNAVAYAHSRGVLHRDLKPGNIMLGKFGETLVVDWGLAKVRGEGGGTRGEDEEQPLRPASLSGSVETMAGAAMGTPAFMSPEQAAGRLELLGPATDIYSLGATLYVLLTGHVPFEGDDAGEVLRRVQRGDYVPLAPRLSPLAPRLSSLAPLAAICQKAMALRPQDRYATVLALAADIEHWLADEPVSAWPEPVLVKLGRWTRRHKPLVSGAAAALLVALLAATAGTLWYQNEQARQAADEARRSTELALRREYLNKEVGQALDETAKKRRELHDTLQDPRQVCELLSDIDQWRARVREARAAWRRARALADGSLELLDQEIGARLANLERKLADDDKDWALAKELDDVRLEASSLVKGKFDRGRAAKKYPGVFARAGLAVEQGEPAEVAERIARSPARYALVAALDHWANFTRDQKLLPRLLELARTADPHPWRDHFRSVKVWEDLKELERLAKEVRPDEQSPQLMLALARRLKVQGGDAAEVLRRALLYHSRDFWLFFELGNRAKDPVERLGCFQAALAVRPQSSTAHNNLGAALYDKKDLEGAISHSRKAIQLDPNFAFAHHNLGSALRDKMDLAGAISHLCKAIEVEPNYAPAHISLGLALKDKKDLEGAISHFRKAIQIEPNYALAHNNLGAALYDKEDLVGAISHYRKAIQIDRNLASAHNNLALALLQDGQFAEARATTLSFLTLLPGNHPSRQVAQRQLKQCDNLLVLDGKLATFVEASQAPKGIDDCLALVELCRRYKHYHAAAARLYAAAFELQPTLAGDLAKANRYDAASSALLAAAGKGLDPQKPDAQQRIKLRAQALAWLRADMEAFAGQARAGHVPSLLLMLDRLAHWQKDADLASVREPAALALLPTPEQAAWKKLWADAEQFLKQVRAGITEAQFQGTLTAKERERSYELNLEPGKTYVIDLHSAAFDAYLKLVGANGKVLAENDDIAPGNQDARLIFTPLAAGKFRIVATSFEGRGIGRYVLTIRAIDRKK